MKYADIAPMLASHLTDAEIKAEVAKRRQAPGPAASLAPPVSRSQVRSVVAALRDVTEAGGIITIAQRYGVPVSIVKEILHELTALARASGGDDGLG